MKKKYKLYLKLNLVSLVFIVISFISVTLAWFAYSGLTDASMEIGVKAWYVELDKDGKAVSNDIVISLSEIYPGMDIVNEMVNIKNKGDSDAQVNYSIVSARILGNEEDNYTINDTNTSSYVEDILSHNYPFKVNINLAKNYVLAKGGEDAFMVSVSWPLDSDDDNLDSSWGSKAYLFQQEEQTKKAADSSYQVKPAIQIVISVKAEQYLNSDTTSDPRYNLGDSILFDVESNKRCSTVSSTCLSTYVIDVNNTLGDDTVTLLPNPKNNYITGTYNDYNSLISNLTSSWTVSNRSLLVDDILKITSTDVMNSFLIREGISDSIIGDLKYGTRLNTEFNKAVTYNGYYTFLNNKFEFLSTVNCYWTSSSYNTDNGVGIVKMNDTKSKIYGLSKTSTCNVIPVIIASKNNL